MQHEPVAVEARSKKEKEKASGRGDPRKV